MPPSAALHSGAGLGTPTSVSLKIFRLGYGFWLTFDLKRKQSANICHAIDALRCPLLNSIHSLIHKVKQLRGAYSSREHEFFCELNSGLTSKAKVQPGIVVVRHWARWSYITVWLMFKRKWPGLKFQHRWCRDFTGKWRLQFDTFYTCSLVIICKAYVLFFSGYESWSCMINLMAINITISRYIYLWPSSQLSCWLFQGVTSVRHVVRFLSLSWWNQHLSKMI